MASDRRIDQTGTWLDANRGADGWAMMAPTALHDVPNDAIALYPCVDADDADYDRRRDEVSLDEVERIVI